ncbi:protein FAR1-RELATED SEQUENCE 5-like [Curcuma longa]
MEEALDNYNFEEEVLYADVDGGNNDHTGPDNNEVLMEDPNIVSEEGIIVGKKFSSPEEAYASYNSYALVTGFGIRKQHFTRSRTTGDITRYRYACNKAGNSKDPTPSIRAQGKQVRGSKVNCKALMEISTIPGGGWAITRFDDTHSHELTSPSKTRKHRSHKIIHRSKACKSLVEELDQNGLRPTQIKKVVSVISGVDDEIISSKQVSNMLGIERKRHLGMECYGIIQHFKKKAEVDDTHFFAMDLHSDGSLRNVFWADGRSRASYYTFGDVLVFDVTYRTNKFKMPFAPFVGVNHHYQSILFGGALLEDEKEETFVWLFTQFLRCMFNKVPISIITDQDGAICNAVKRVFPNTCHRFCSWHIRKHMVEHLQSETLRFPNFNSDLKEVLKSRTINDFERRWATLYDRYEISAGSRSWLDRMYHLRQHWAKAFLKDVFFAGMTTSGRCESIHSFFDGFVNSNTTLDKFVLQYDSAISSRRQAEEDADFKTSNTVPSSNDTHPFVVKAGKFYTAIMNGKFLREWHLAANACTHETLEKSGVTTSYQVGAFSVPMEHWHRVDFNVVEPSISTCTCARMETFGIPCRHILYIFKKKKVVDLPDSLIRKRWTINARYKSSHADNRSTRDVSVRYLNVSAKWLNVMRRAKRHDDVMGQVEKFFDGILLQLDEKDSLQTYDVSQADGESVFSGILSYSFSNMYDQVIVLPRLFQCFCRKCTSSNFF